MSTFSSYQQEPIAIGRSLPDVKKLGLKPPVLGEHEKYFFECHTRPHAFFFALQNMRGGYNILLRGHFTCWGG